MCIFKAVGLSMGRETLLSEKKRGEGEIEKRKQDSLLAKGLIPVRKEVQISAPPPISHLTTKC